MKIAFIGQKGIPAKTGGVEKHVECLATSLAKMGHEITVYSHRNYNNLKQYQGVNIIPVSVIPFKNLEAISYTFLASLKVIFQKVDLIHFHSIGPASMIWLVKLFKPKTPIVFTFHCQDYHHQKWGKFARLYLRFGEYVGNKLADKVIVVSKELKEYATKKYNNNPEYVPNGTAHEFGQINDNLIKKFGLESGKYLLTTSRLVRHKGLQYLIPAFKALKHKKYKLVIAGDAAYTDDYVSELKAMAEGDDNIIFVGNQQGETLEALYKNAKVFVQPSESEGLSIALLEAMSFGSLIVSSDIVANVESVEDGALLFKTKDVADLEDKLNQALELNEDQANVFKTKVKEKVKNEYSWPQISTNIVKLYQVLT